VVRAALSTSCRASRSTRRRADLRSAPRRSISTALSLARPHRCPPRRLSAPGHTSPRDLRERAATAPSRTGGVLSPLNPRARTQGGLARVHAHGAGPGFRHAPKARAQSLPQVGLNLYGRSRASIDLRFCLYFRLACAGFLLWLDTKHGRAEQTTLSYLILPLHTVIAVCNGWACNCYGYMRQFDVWIHSHYTILVVHWVIACYDAIYRRQCIADIEQRKTDWWTDE